MIKIFQNDSILNNDIKDNSIIITSKNKIYKYKIHFLNKNVKITSLDMYLNELSKKYFNKRLANSNESLILMYEAYRKVVDKLSFYKNQDVSFAKNLCLTYEFYLENDCIKSSKTKDLDIIYEKYNDLLNRHNLVSLPNLFNYSYIDKISYDNIYFEDVISLNRFEISFINSIKDYKNVYVFANTINNMSLVSDLNNLSPCFYEPIDNLDINNLFNINSCKIFKNINIVSCNDLYEEVKFLNEDIIKNVNKGLKYKDILVISNDIKRYQNYFDMIFSIPFSRKIRQKVITSNFIQNLKNILNGNFSCQNFLNLIKLNLFSIDLKNIDILDNYIYVNGLFDKPFYEPFTKYNDKREKENLSMLNEIRVDVINPIKCLLENVINVNDTLEVLRYLFMYIDEEGITDKLATLDFEGYNDLINALELLNDTTSNLNITMVLDYLSNILTSNLKENYMQDEVRIESLDDYSFSPYKKVYFIGVTEKDLPVKFSYKTLINSSDLNHKDIYNLIKKHNDKYQNIISNILINKDVTITYHKINDSKNKLNKSTILSSFFNDDTHYTYSLNKDTVLNQDKKIDKSLALNLYGSTLTLSPSSIETYSKCHYSYFLKYGLNLNVKEKNVFDSRKKGTFVHYILENTIKNNVTIKTINEMVDKYTNSYLDSCSYNIDNITLYLISILKEKTKKLLSIILEELKNTKFKPEAVELKIKDMNFSIKLDDGVLNITGTVDRLDSYVLDDTYYYRIIDYKTGKKAFKLSDVINGLNMQMIVYLLAIKNLDKKNKINKPTGFLYYPALINYKKESINLSKDEVLEKLKKQMRLNGIISSSSLEFYNDNINDYVDVKTRDNISSDKVFSDDDLNIVFNKVMENLKKEGNKILSGNISINPIIDSNNDSCAFCKFNSVCGFNKLNGDVRKYKNMSNSLALKLIKEEGDINGLDFRSTKSDK